MGEVYLAEDGNLGRRVAVKVVRHGFRTGRLLQHFRHEERILAALNDPHIARLYGSAVAPGGAPYFVMESVEGERLDTYCGSRTLAVEERPALFRKVCAAVLGLLGRARTLLEMTLSWDGRQAEGEAEMARAFAIMEGLVAALPQDGVWRQGLLDTYEQGSQLYGGVDDARAYEITLKARDLAERALREDAADVQAQQNVAKCRVRLGTIALRLHRADAAVESLTQAAAAFTKLAGNPRSGRSYEIDLGGAEAMLGEARTEQRQIPDAQASFHRAVALYETMLRADPANKMPLRKLCCREAKAP